MFYKTIVCVLIAAAAITAVERRERTLYSPVSLSPKRRSGRTVLVEPLLLPLFLILLYVLFVWNIPDGVTYAENNWTLWLSAAGLLLQLALYQLLLLCLMPLLRRYVSARSCASLWLLPNLLYLTTFVPYQTRSLVVLTLPRSWMLALGWVWLAGFAAVMFWLLGAHLVCRHRLLHDVERVTDERILSLWQSELARQGLWQKIPVRRSQDVKTPVTVGCFTISMRLVLPRTYYTDEDLALIFRHEAAHIRNCDTRTKLFIGFCTALCWFSPFAWMARRRVSEDLELSCDERVLLLEDDKTRRRYAELLLQCADGGAGFTTCLSASASTLRYRLKNVIQPAKRAVGGVVVGAVLFVLLMSSGNLALADTTRTVREAVFEQAPAGIAIDEVHAVNWDDSSHGYRPIYGRDEAALTEYLSSLRVRMVYSGEFPEPEDDRSLLVAYAETEDGVTVSRTLLSLHNDILYVSIPYDSRADIACLLEEPPDWDYLSSLLDFDAVDPDPAPQPPELCVHFQGGEGMDDDPIYAQSSILWIEDAGVRREDSERLNEGGVGGVYGAPFTEAVLEFSYAPEDDYTVTVKSWDGADAYTVTGSELEDNLLPLAPYSANYTVSGRFHTVRDTTYVMEFYFDVEYEPNQPEL